MSMFRLIRPFLREPHRVVGVLWPLALVVPFLPGLPRPANGGLTWRQETAVSLLLLITFALLLRRRKRRGAQASNSPARPSDINRPELALLAPLAAFVAWGAASALWATNFYAAVHYALSWGTYLLFFVSLRRAAERPRLLRASLGLLAVVVLVISAANVVGHYGSANSLIRQHGLGEPVAVSIPLFAALALTVRRRGAALLCGAAAAVAWLSLLQIAERAPFVGVGCGFAVLAAAMLARPRFRPRTLARTLALAAAFAACAALHAAPSPFEQSIHPTVFARLQETSGAEANTRARFLYWGAAVEMGRARPATGVGAGGFDGAFPEARASFVAQRPNSPLVGINESYLSTGAHNEYLQILAELGAVGLVLFVAFAGALVWAAWRALARASSALAPGAVASLAVFAVSSGASSISFRWFGSGLVFFFAAALVTRFAAAVRPLDARAEERTGADVQARENAEALGDAEASGRGLSYALPSFTRSSALMRRAEALGLVVALVVTAAMCVQAANVLLLASAQSSADAERAERLYASALGLNPLDAATRYNYGVWLFVRKREREAVPHLRFAVERGFHAATCYAYLAGAESNAGQTEDAARTLAFATRVYPRSVFLRARYASALARAGRGDEAEMEMRAALLLDSRAARGWRHLIDDDIDAAVAAARRDRGVAMPGELLPEDGVFAVLAENERRFPGAVSTGWRARRRSHTTR